MGLGISLMHYVGMSAVHLAGPTSYAPSYVAASIAVSIAASAFALWALGSRPTRPRLFLGAVALGLAISGMHYTAMAGMRLDPLCFDVSRFVGAESALSRNTLALLATVVSFGVSGAFLLSLVPDAARAPKRRAALAPPDAAAGPAARRARSGAAPLDFGAPPPARATAFIPVEKDGRTRELAVADIYAIRANAHYTYVHDGEQEYFCNLSISALRRASIRKRSCECTAATSSRSIASRGSSDRARRAWRSWACLCAAASRLRAAHYRQVKLRIDALAG